MKVDILLDDYSYICGDGCCEDYGTRIVVNGEEMPCTNEDTETILKQVLEHLGYEVTIKTTYNGK